MKKGISYSLSEGGAWLAESQSPGAAMLAARFIVTGSYSLVSNGGLWICHYWGRDFPGPRPVESRRLPPLPSGCLATGVSGFAKEKAGGYLPSVAIDLCFPSNELIIRGDGPF